MNKILLAGIALNISFCSVSFAADIIHQGEEHFVLNTISAVKLNGELASERYIVECRHQYISLLGKTVDVKYSIGIDTQIQSATASYSQIPAVDLHPMGIANAYDFMSDLNSPIKNMQRIVFDMSKQFHEPKIYLLYTNKMNPNTNCLLSG
jgi:hypothetical protein